MIALHFLVKLQVKCMGYRYKLSAWEKYIVEEAGVRSHQGYKFLQLVAARDVWETAAVLGTGQIRACEGAASLQAAQRELAKNQAARRVLDQGQGPSGLLEAWQNVNRSKTWTYHRQVSQKYAFSMSNMICYHCAYLGTSLIDPLDLQLIAKYCSKQPKL